MNIENYKFKIGDKFRYNPDYCNYRLTIIGYKSSMTNIRTYVVEEYNGYDHIKELLVRESFLCNSTIKFNNFWQNVNYV